MVKTWQLQEAKSKFSQVIEKAVSSGPQIITKHGVEVVIVISYARYQQITAPRGKLSDFFRESPLVGVDMDLARDKSDARINVEP